MTSVAQCKEQGLGVSGVYVSDLKYPLSLNY